MMRMGMLIVSAPLFLFLFLVSLTFRLQGPNWPAYKSGPGPTVGLGTLLELNGTSSRVVRDDFRLKEIDYLLKRQDILHR